MLIVKQMMSLADSRHFTKSSMVFEGFKRVTIRENQSENSPWHLQSEFMVHLAYSSFGN